MADNFPLTPGSGRSAATDQVTYSGDTADVQLIRLVLVTGAEGSKTVVELGGDATNGLDVDVTRSVLPTGAATEATLTLVDNGVATVGQECTLIRNAVEIIDDTVATDGSAAPTKGIMLAGTDGTNAQTVKVDASGELQIDVLTLPALPAGTNNIGDVDVLSLPALPAGTNNIGDVDVLTLPALPAGTNNIGDVDVLTLPGVAGDVAHDGADSGNPLKVGAKAISHGSSPTAVAANDRTNLYANIHGIPFVIAGHPNIVTARANSSSAQTDVVLVTANTGQKIVVTRASVMCDKANSVDVAARIGFGTANTPTTTGVVLSHPGIAAGSGVVEGNGSGMLGVGGDGEDLRITNEVPTGGSIDAVVSYYIIES